MGRETVYCVVDILIEKDGKIVLIRRANDPFKGSRAIPGGFVDPGETAERAAVREAKEETGLDVEVTDIVGVYSDPERDPRGASLSVAFAAKVTGGELKGGDDASDAEWADLSKVGGMKIAFDHPKILRDYLRWKKGKGTYWSTK